MYLDRREHSDGARRFGALAGTTLLVMACTGQSPSGPPPTATPSPTASVVSPSASAVVPTSSPAPPTPTMSPTPSPKPTPKPITSGVWVKAGTVAREIADSQVVALRDGGALLIGIETARVGDDYVTRTATEVWSPKTGKWHSTAALPKFRTSFAAVTLRDGRVLVAGGYNEDHVSYSSAHIFNPKTEAWSKTGLMTVARTHPGLAVLRDGRVLVVGGYYASEPLADVAGGVRAASPSRSSNPVAAVRASWYDVIEPPFGRALATAELFDPTTGEWTATGSMRYARSGPEVVTLTDGRVLVVGSSPDNVRTDERAYDTAEIYDPATGRFTSVGALPEIDYEAISRLGVRLPLSAPMPGVVGSLVAIPDGGAVLVGYSGWWKHQAEIVRSFRFDVGAKRWRDVGRTYAAVFEPTQSATKTVSRIDAVIAGLKDGSVLVAGGYFGGRPTRNVERYDPTGDAWSRLPNMPQARASAAAVALADGSVMLAGGWTEQWEPTAYRFVPRS